MERKIKVGIIGAGSWGSALSIYFSKIGFDVILWVRENQLYDFLQKKRENYIFLPGIKFPKNIFFTQNFKDFNFTNLIFLTIPTQHLRNTLKKLKKGIKNKIDLINCSKGIEIKGLKFPSEIIREELKEKINNLGSLSGPTFAKEFVNFMPTAAVIASENIKFAKEIQENFSSRFFRLYRSKDLKGVEIAGALKNIYAIGAGIIKGLGFEKNTWASFLARSLHEMKRFFLRFGGEPETLYGLAGFGDLVLTSSSEKSRNFQVGLKIAKGESLNEILKNMEMVAEGVYTLKAVYEILKKEKIEMPIVKALYKVLYENLKPKKAIEELMLRELKEEGEI